MMRCRNYITYRNPARRLPSHGHKGSAQKIREDRSSGSRGVLADRQTHVCLGTERQTDTQTDRQTDRNTPLPYQGGVIIAHETKIASVTFDPVTVTTHAYVFIQYTLQSLLGFNGCVNCSNESSTAVGTSYSLPVNEQVCPK